MLAEAIDSVLGQTRAATEIIVIDDGSVDATADLLAKRYPQVRYFHQSNQGPAAARNRGIECATGEWIAFLDSDDVWLDHKIALDMALMERFPEADLLAGNASSFVEGALRSADSFAQRGILFERHSPRFFDWSLPIMKRGPVCFMSSMVCRRSALRRLGDKPFDESLRMDEDWDLEFRFFSQFTGLLFPEVVCHRRVIDDGTRHFYSAAGQPKSRSEQQRIWHQQRGIIARYVDNPRWDRETSESFRHRMQELDALLGENA
jgi:glycosyltransferase involved in cell wall biosynthesis